MIEAIITGIVATGMTKELIIVFQFFTHLILFAIFVQPISKPYNRGNYINDAARALWFKELEKYNRK